MRPGAMRFVRHAIALSPILIAGGITFAGLHIGNAAYQFARTVAQNTEAVNLGSDVLIATIKELRASRQEVRVGREELQRVVEACKP